MSHLPDKTIGFYAAEAEAYSARGRVAALERLRPFCAALPSGGRILEIGCGSGEDSEAMLALGFDVTPTDGTPEMAEIAERRLGRPVAVLRFENIDAVDAYEGIWASACLLHVPRADLGHVLGRIRIALRPDGLFYASFKSGTEEGLDRLGRYYNRPQRAWLEALYGEVGWRNIAVEEVSGGGYDGEATNWLHVTARR